MEEVDVCIVGSGPAGACTSMMLSKMQIKHFLIDKAIFPRDKTCGDGLILHVFKALKIVDPALLEKFLVHPKFIHANRAKFYVNDEIHIQVDYPVEENHDPIYYGKRIDFDDFLFQHCASEYMIPFFGKSVNKLERLSNGIILNLSDGSAIKTKMLIGADGNNSIVSKKLAFNKVNPKYNSTFISAYFSGVRINEFLEAEIRIVRVNTPLFFYIFPLPNGEANVSIGGISANIQKYKIDLKKEINKLLTEHSVISIKFIDAQQIGKWRGWGIPSNVENLTVSGDRFLLTGDAAGLANAFYKEGVGTAMMSGIIAAKKVQEALIHNDFTADFLKNYDENLNSEFGKLLKFSRFATRATKLKILFNAASKMFKSKIEHKISEVIKSRTYN